jgi:para-aminobenzoate synthetase / 4-amino-4-deoxychorismate lyase
MTSIKPQSESVAANEVLLKENDRWLHFADPQKIIVAQIVEDVLPALNEIERLISTNHWYAAGFISYEAGPAFDPAFPERLQPESGFPYLWFGLYEEPRVSQLPQPTRPKEILQWQPMLDRESYHSAIAQIKDYIANGRTYQVNYTMRLQADFTGSAWEFFLHLVQNQNKHAAYVDTGRFVVGSASPELFFELDGDRITCRPMKGTAKRGRTTAEDHDRSEWLKHSEKNRAENVMIVDMMRNDLGKIAETGSIHVPELFETERYRTLWQMTSTVTAKTNSSITDIFTAIFPSASITGAPKVSTSKFIAELENTPRKIYTGSIGYMAPRRKAKFNVAIRTLLIDRKRQKAEYGIGGGVVWDSTGPDEYAEALLKARVLTEQPSIFSLLETMLWIPEIGFFLCEKHIARMLDSADYFDFRLSREKLKAYLDQISSRFCAPQRVRVLLDQTGSLTSESMPFEAEDSVQPVKACLAKKPIDSRNVFLYHKTTQRTVYESAKENFEGFDDVLLYNESGELTEFTIGNLVVELDGQLLTPPISCGVLPGTFRAYLIETGQVLERAVSVDELKNCTRIFRANSLRKWQGVELCSHTDQ